MTKKKSFMNLAPGRLEVCSNPEKSHSKQLKAKMEKSPTIVGAKEVLCSKFLHI
jgi:hypothetical protein